MDSDAIIALAAALGGFLAKELWDGVKGRLSKADAQRDAMLADSIKATTELTLAVTKLEVKMEGLIARLDELPEIKKDVNEAHLKIREMRSLMPK